MSDQQVPEWGGERTSQHGEAVVRDGRGPAEQQQAVQDGQNGQPAQLRLLPGQELFSVGDSYVLLQKPVVLAILKPLEAGTLHQTTQPQQRTGDGSELGRRTAS